MRFAITSSLTSVVSFEWSIDLTYLIILEW